jgi:hypothetical protein
VKTRTAVGLGAAACIPCCAGPILAVLGAVTALGLAASLVIGAAGLFLAAAAVAAAIFVRRRAHRAGAPVAVELTRSP